MKACSISIKFDTKWILANQVGGKSTVVDDVLALIKQHYPDNVIVVLKKEFHQCKLIIAADSIPESEKISVMIKSSVAGASDSDIKINVELIDNKQLESFLASAKEALTEKEQKFFEKEFNISTKKESGFNVLSNKPSAKITLDELIGLDNFKSWMTEIQKISASFGEITAKSNVIKNIAYLFSINRGNGLSTVLQLMADTLKKSGLVEFLGKKDFVEYKLAYDDNTKGFSSFEGLLHAIGGAGATGLPFKGIVSIDVEEWLDHLTDKRFDLLLNFIVNSRDNLIFVFTVPYVDNAVLGRLYDRIDDVISTRTMKFVPPSDEQYFLYFTKIFATYNIAVAKNAYNSFVSKITAEKNDVKFYGFNTISKIANEMLYGIIANAAKNNTDLPVEITSADFKRIYNLEDGDGITGLEQLNGMVALTEVKNKVQEILSIVKLQKELYSKDNTQLKPCFHMMFTGNPGTGKTVVARIIGKIFKEAGLLEIGNFYEVSKTDFIGKFVGHTGPKTMELCRNAYGSVLFIDEAYLLAEEGEGFCSEAIGTLIAEMENNRDKMIVIFAGYEKELQGLFAVNPGLKDRIPYKIDFPNYNRQELKEIFFMQLNGKVKHSPAFDKKAEEFFETFPDNILNSKDFSNGRFVRNLAERIMSKAALRFEMSNINIDDFELTDSDFSIAASDAEYKKLFDKIKPVKRLGF